MAEGEYVERVTLRVNGVDLDDVINRVTETSSRPTKAVNTMNRARVSRGFKQGNNVYTLDLDAERIVDVRVPDWHVLKDKGAKIGIVVTPSNGMKPVSYGGVVITEVADTSSDGESDRRIRCMARTRK